MSCPVDHKTRDAWLSQARSQEPPSTTQSIAPSKPWTSTLTSFFWSSPETPPNSSPSPSDLSSSRAISTIPRASSDSAPSDSTPANHEIEAALDPSGHWVYPSERMFFDAMRRKGHDAREADMKTVVPIHNAVNERAWKQIQDWEAPYSKECPPKLESFANKMHRMTPTARINTILGYAPPFDRHDWVVDRCGTRVEYVIDFYPGRLGVAAGVPSFYLDVRPKFNTWEGTKMRLMRWMRLS